MRGGRREIYHSKLREMTRRTLKRCDILCFIWFVAEREKKKSVGVRGLREVGRVWDIFGPNMSIIGVGFGLIKWLKIILQNIAKS